MDSQFVLTLWAKSVEICWQAEPWFGAGFNMHPAWSGCTQTNLTVTIQTQHRNPSWVILVIFMQTNLPPSHTGGCELCNKQDIRSVLVSLASPKIIIIVTLRIKKLLHAYTKDSNPLNNLRTNQIILCFCTYLSLFCTDFILCKTLYNLVITQGRK